MQLVNFLTQNEIFYFLIHLAALCVGTLREPEYGPFITSVQNAFSLENLKSHLNGKYCGANYLKS